MPTTNETPELRPPHDPTAVLARNGRARWWQRCGTKEDGFWYADARGTRITDAKQLARIHALALPPGYLEVRVAPSDRSRLQAIAIDAAGRVQYRYHADFVAEQQQKKYAKIERFGELLPCLRRRANADIVQPGFGRDRVLAVVVRLINDLYFRLGSEGSVSRYRTYGVTTLRNHHVRIMPGGQLIFHFVGKHHIHQRHLLVDEDLSNLLHEIKALGGTRLFNYLDATGQVHPITPADVNHYIKSATGPEFSGKDFRTWGGTLQAAVELAHLGKADSPKQVKKNLSIALERVAERLGNTPAVCREHYIHPLIFEHYEQGITLDDFRRPAQRIICRHQPEYEIEEVELLKLFQKGGFNPSGPGGREGAR